MFENNFSLYYYFVALFLAKELYSISWGQRTTVYTLILVATESLTTIYQLCDIRKPNKMQKDLVFSSGN